MACVIDSCYIGLGALLSPSVLGQAYIPDPRYLGLGALLNPSVLGQAYMPDDTTKRLMSSPKCRSVEVISNPARPG